MEEARNLTRELMGLDDDFEVLFLQGGATMQFMQVPMNLLDNSGETASYIDTGVWSNKAIKEAKLFGYVDVAASSKEANYNHIPKQYTIAPSPNTSTSPPTTPFTGRSFMPFPKRMFPW